MKTQLLYNENNELIGRVDENGNIYTPKGKLSQLYINTPRGVQVSGAHLSRERAARNLLDEQSSE